jgi:hypothetical protein
MTKSMRRTVRGMATGLGALAIIAGTAACGGSGEGEEAAETGEQSATQEEPAAEEPAAEDEEGAAEEGAAQEAGPVDEAGLTAAGDRFLEFITVLDDGDAEAACGFFIDPTTGEPVSGATLTQCGEALAPQMESLEPGSMDIIDRSMVETADNGDGSVSVSMSGTDFPYSMVQGSDGQWYMSMT